MAREVGTPTRTTTRNTLPVTDLTGQTTSPRPPSPSPTDMRPPTVAKKAPAKKATASGGRGSTTAPKPAVSVKGFAGINTAFDQRLQALINAAPGRITITSGYRTVAQQQKLYDAYLNGTGNLAAKPGSSNHNFGLAYDIGFADDATRRWAHANAAKFGLVFPIKSESWHVEPIETRGQKLGSAAVAAGFKPIDVAATKAAAASGVSVDGGAAAFGADGKVDPEDAIAEYGYIAELAKSVPDIKRVLTMAIDNGWTATRFTAEIQKTKWWQTTNESQRQVELLKKTNPGEYRRQRQEMIDKMVITARNLGVEEGNQRIFILAERALSLGWSDQEIQRYLAADIKVADPNDPKAKQNTGMTATTVDSLQQQAAQFGVPMSRATLQTWTTQILRGMTDEESFTSYLKQQAKSLFPNNAGLHQALDAGLTVEDYMAPYKEWTAQILERNPAEIALTDKHLQRALYAQDDKGVRTTMSLADYQTYLRRTDEFRKTRQAGEMEAEVTGAITKLFGAVA